MNNKWLLPFIIFIVFVICYWIFLKLTEPFRLDNFVESFATVSKYDDIVKRKEKFFNFFKSQDDDDPRKSNQIITYNGKKWVVQQADSVALLQEIIVRINQLIDNIRANPEKTYTLNRLKYWDNTFVMENIKESWKNDSTSYSINKGEELVFCIRDKVNNSLHDINTLMFVAIHELAHIITNELQHTDKFWTNMKSLLSRAEKLKLYHSVDYSLNPVEYCGMMIDSSP